MRMKRIARVVKLGVLIALWGYGSGARAACEGPVRTPGILDNLDTTKKVELPQGTLVSLYQNEGIDPFNFFQEGMDPANENGLNVENDKAGLSVGLGGARFVNETDGSCDFRVEALEYNAVTQRFFVHCAIKAGGGYQILVNVDVAKQQAKVWMKEADEKLKWSDWAVAALYSAEKTEPSPEKEYTLADLPDVAVTDKYNGIKCQNHTEGWQLFAMDGPASMKLHYESFETSDIVGAVTVNDKFQKIVATGDLRKLHRLHLVDGDKTDLQFTASDSSDPAKPTLEITGKLKGKNIKLTKCYSWVREKSGIF
jgi:hypothetical protein